MMTENFIYVSEYRLQSEFLKQEPPKGGTPNNLQQLKSISHGASSLFSITCRPRLIHLSTRSNNGPSDEITTSPDKMISRSGLKVVSTRHGYAWCSASSRSRLAS